MQECPMKLNYYLFKRMVSFSRITTKKHALNSCWNKFKNDLRFCLSSRCFLKQPTNFPVFHVSLEDSHCPNLTLGKLRETQVDWFSIDMNLGGRTGVGRFCGFEGKKFSARKTFWKLRIYIIFRWIWWILIGLLIDGLVGWWVASSLAGCMHAWMNEEIEDGSLQEAGTRQKSDCWHHTMEI